MILIVLNVCFLGQSHILKSPHVNGHIYFHYNKVHGVFDQKMSSILNYFKIKAPQNIGEFLPDPTKSSSSISERSIMLENDEVRLLTELKPKWRKTEQHTYFEKTS